jgi:hypothetical protein
MKECEHIIHTLDNIVFIAIRQGCERKFLPFPPIQAISVAPGELADTLKLIPDFSVVLCGQVELCTSIVSVRATAGLTDDLVCR